MEKLSIKPEEFDITLISTEATKEVASTVSRFLESNYNLKKINLINYDSFLQMINSISSEEKVYFNMTPGMNWQVSEIILKLNTDCDIIILYQDYSYLYLISPKYTFGKILEKVLLPNLGLQRYFELNQEFILQKKDDNNLYISLINNYPIIDIINKDIDKKVIELLNSKINTYIKNLINQLNKYLVAIKEHRGYLHLYFDFSEFRKTDVENIYQLYRIIISFFNPLNYGLYFYIKPDQNSSITMFQNRLITDDIYFTSDRNLFNQWINQPPLPHKIRPRFETTLTKITPHNVVLKPEFKKNRVGVVVLGDNITLTLQTIFNWKHVDGFLIFYDASSERIVYFKEIIKKNLYKWILQISGKFLEFIETNHIGENIGYAIQNFLTNSAKNRRLTFDINITPGTKSHTIFLTIYAKQNTDSTRIYSFDNKKSTFICLNDKNISIKMHTPIHIDSLLPFYYTSCQDEKVLLKIVKENNKILDEIFDGLLNEQYDQVCSLKDMIYKNSSQKVFEITDIGDSVLITSIKTGHQGKFPRMFIIEQHSKYVLLHNNTTLDVYPPSGRWWELVVIHKILSSQLISEKDLFYSLKWTFRNTIPLSEKDIVFSYGNNPVIIDCTITRNLENLIKKWFITIGDNQRRFTRMSLSFIAVPRRWLIVNLDQTKKVKLDFGDLIFFNKKENFALAFLTPKDLKDKESIISAIEKFRKYLQTTN